MDCTVLADCVSKGVFGSSMPVDDKLWIMFMIDPEQNIYLRQTTTPNDGSRRNVDYSRYGKLEGWGLSVEQLNSYRSATDSNASPVSALIMRFLNQTGLASEISRSTDVGDSWSLALLTAECSMRILDDGGYLLIVRLPICQDIIEPDPSMMNIIFKTHITRLIELYFHAICMDNKFMHDIGHAVASKFTVPNCFEKLLKCGKIEVRKAKMSADVKWVTCLFQNSRSAISVTVKKWGIFTPEKPYVLGFFINWESRSNVEIYPGCQYSRRSKKTLLWPRKHLLAAHMINDLELLFYYLIDEIDIHKPSTDIIPGFDFESFDAIPV